MAKVYLGGTCNDSTWRDELIKMLKVDYYNPVVQDWTPECREYARYQRHICDYCLYVITPRMTGVYAIAEAVDDSHRRPNKTIFCVLKKDGELTFSLDQLRSLEAVGEMIDRNGGWYMHSLVEVADFLNQQSDSEEPPSTDVTSAAWSHWPQLWSASREKRGGGDLA